MIETLEAMYRHHLVEGNTALADEHDGPAHREKAAALSAAIEALRAWEAVQSLLNSSSGLDVTFAQIVCPSHNIVTCSLAKIHGDAPTPQSAALAAGERIKEGT